MPSLLLPSPTLLDQSFPRTNEELKVISVSLSGMLELVREGECGLLSTEALRDFVEKFDWDRTGPYPLLMDIYRFLSQMLLYPSDYVFEVDVSGATGNMLHPTPTACSSRGLSGDWSIEAGKVLELHLRHSGLQDAHIGVACAQAFAGEAKDSYAVQVPAFPLVGPDDIGSLSDAYEWNVPSDIHQKSISFAEVRKNCFAIGATEILMPKGSSHYMVKFARRPWPLDCNTDPVPERFLGQLEDITGYPLPVIKTALIYGALPSKRPKISSLRSTSQ
ncbi:hypothetical protein NR800_12025 [Corallococcus interemptor]|uniref:hypothetical protein n=1 Tax=Corallococcus interemptor TaxID=2316720 RepID=UPI0035D3F643